MEEKPLRLEIPRRKVACSNCHSVRRSCVAVANSERCQRCTKNDFECSFPIPYQRRTPPARSWSSPPSSSTSAMILSPPLRTNSPSATLVGVQLSISLSYHLLELSKRHGLRPTDGPVVTNLLSGPIDRGRRIAIAEEKDEAVKRTAVRGVEAEISTLVDLFQAARISTHSAIIGADAPPATFLDILSPAEGTLIPAYGNTRRRVLLALHNRLSAALDDMSTPLEDWDDEADRLSFIYFIHWKCYSAELPQWHHESTRDVVAAAVRLLDRAPPSWKGRQRVLRTIQQCLAVHYMQATGNGFPLLIPLKDCIRFTPLPPDEAKTPNDLSANESLSDDDFFDYHAHLFTTISLTLLTPPQPPPLTEILSSFTKAYQVLASFDRALTRLLDSSSVPSSPSLEEPMTAVQRTAPWALTFPGVLIGCFHALAKHPNVETDVKRDHLLKFQRLIARSYPRAADFSMHIHALDLTPALRLDALYPWPALLRYTGMTGVSSVDEFSRLSSEQKAYFLRMLRFNSFSNHTACVILDELQTSGVLNPPPAERDAEVLANEMVEAAFAEVVS